MTPQFRIVRLAAAAAALLALASAAPGLADQAPSPATAAAAAPPSAADFGREAAISNVSLAPDGKHIAALRSPDGEKLYVSIWATDAMDKPPVNLLCGERSQCVGVAFVKSDRIRVNVRQTITSGAVRTHLFRFFTTDLEGKVWRNALGTTDQTVGPNARVVSTLPRDPKNILIRSFEDGDFYLLDLYSGARRKTFTGSDKFGGEQVDLKGEIRARQSVDFDNGKVYIAQWIRNPANDQWEEHFRWYAADREPKEIVGFSTDPNIIYVATNAGRDKSAIFEYDIAAKKFLEPIFEIKLFDASGILLSSAASNYGEILGFRYQGETGKTYWVDERLKSIASGLRKALGVSTVPVQWTDIATGEKARFSTGDGADVEIIDWSDDMKYVLVEKSGPRQPPQYFLLTDGVKLNPLGDSRPWLNTATLGDVRLVQYAARDGLMIPAFLATPRKEIYGPGPYPTIIHPHGGPWGRDSMDWDVSGWTQYFVARGYAVLQPQFRGSEGWGQKLWRAGDAEWGQKMQDDKDDGAKWLIAQGIADPNRITMHGYSYGGYSAMAAAVRPNGLYQCAVAGAGVASIDKFREVVNQSRIGREFQRPTINGLSPIDHVADVSIPVFLYHGDRDTTVPISESERFVAGLKAAGKPYKFLPIKDMGHQYIVWEPGQAEQVLEAIDAYLRTECGPGGL
ncbi:MAG: alpha/beta hydrolase family protein [Pseudomonadota bacterium]